MFQIGSKHCPPSFFRVVGDLAYPGTRTSRLPSADNCLEFADIFCSLYFHLNILLVIISGKLKRKKYCLKIYKIKLYTLPNKMRPKTVQ